MEDPKLRERNHDGRFDVKIAPGAFKKRKTSTNRIAMSPFGGHPDECSIRKPGRHHFDEHRPARPKEIDNHPIRRSRRETKLAFPFFEAFAHSRKAHAMTTHLAGLLASRKTRFEQKPEELLLADLFLR